MTKTKSTKRALLSSILALVMCFSMLIGSTFAWFTDSVSSANNIIQSGNLDVNLYYWDNSMATGTSVAIEDEADLKLFKNVDGEDILWEPGATGFGQFEVANEGSLALKYQLQINFANATETADGKTLADVLSIYALARNGKTGADDVMEDANLEELRTTYIDSTVPGYESQSLKNFVLEGYLLPGEAFRYELGVFWDPSDKDNEYNVAGGLSMDFGVTLLATQMTYEEDSYDDQYDEEALYPVIAKDADQLNTALANAVPGDVISLVADVDYGTVTLGELEDVVISGADGATAIIKTDATTKLEDVTIKEVQFTYTGATADCGVVINADAQIDNLVIENCTFTGKNTKAGRGLSGYNNNASIVIKNCTFEDMGYPIYAWGGYDSLEINHCVFDNIKSWAIMPQSGFNGDLTITNCEFKNCVGGLLKGGTLTADHTFTFTGNNITGSTVSGDHNWFQFNATAGTVILENNTKDNAAWTPGVSDGLKY